MEVSRVWNDSSKMLKQTKRKLEFYAQCKSLKNEGKIFFRSILHEILKEFLHDAGKWS